MSALTDDTGARFWEDARCSCCDALTSNEFRGELVCRDCVEHIESREWLARMCAKPEPSDGEAA